MYTGSGKGKTTAAIGLGMRAAGAGLKVNMIQFMKGRKYCELVAINNISNFSYSQHGRDEFVNKENPEQIDIDLAQKGLKHAKEIIKSDKYDVVILDDINVVIDFNLINLNQVLKLIREKPEKLELVLTGRYAPSKIIKVADYVSEILEIKHVYQKGIKARKGIEY